MPRQFSNSIVCLICLSSFLFAGCAVEPDSADKPRSESVSTDAEKAEMDQTQSVKVPASGTDANGNVEHTIVHDGLERSYIVHFPPNYVANGEAALVMSLHGRPGTSHETMKAQRWGDVGDKENFVVVYPQGSEVLWREKSLTHWNALNMETGVDDVSFLKHVVASIVEDYDTDPKRTYVAGFSNGGMMVSRLACEAGDTFAAMASVAGVGSTAHTDCVPEQVTPIAFIHGEKDELPPKEGRASNLRPVQETLDVFINTYGCSKDPTIRELEDVDQADQTTTIHTAYVDCSKGATVEYFFVQNGGHTWPGNTPNERLGHTSQDFKATEELWAFFKQHKRQEN